MRPVELTLEGFRSYASRTVFRFEGRRLIGICGPIGAGKSSVLDAICFALYGKTPTITGGTRDLIHQRADVALVELVFDVEGHRWRAVRGQRRKGQPPTQLSRLGDDGEPVVVATGRKEMNDRIERLLGLPFEGFCRSALLAQNRFAEFLQADPVDRDKVLKGVFGFDVLDHAQALAKQKLAEVAVRLEEFDHRRAEIEDARLRLDVSRKEEAVAKARLDDLRKAKPRIDEQRAARDDAARAEREDATVLAGIEAVIESLPGSEEVGALLSAAEQAEAAVEKASTEAAAAEKSRGAAAATLREAERKAGGRPSLGEARRLLAAAAEREEALGRERALLEDAERALTESAGATKRERAALAKAEAAEQKAERALVTAESKVADLRVKLEEAQHAEMALTLRGELTSGDRCPVCAQPVHVVPRTARAPKREGVKHRLDRGLETAGEARGLRQSAAKTAAAAKRAVEAADNDLTRAERDRKTAATGVERRAEAMREVRAAIAKLLGKEEPERTLAEREAVLDHADAALDEAEEAARAARDSLDEQRRAVEEGRADLQRLAQRLVGAWGRLDEERQIEPAAPIVRRAYVELASALARTREHALEAQERARSAASEAGRRLAELLDAAGLGADQDFDEALNAALADHAASQKETTLLDERVKSAASIEKRARQALARRDTLTRLASDLTPSRFLRYLLTEERARLAELGSEHCERLTAGRYRFSDDGSFDIVDLNAAGNVRHADSLSGGEIFLASLALALALAEMVARGGGRLDAFFLDEGFGALDPEHLDLAMDGIDRLVADSAGRLVVVVSHVPEMRERIEDLIVLAKDDVTGDTRVDSGATRSGS